MRLVVCDSRTIATDIRTLTLRDPAGARLPSFAAGSHLVVRAGTRRNAYSLTSTGTAPWEYRISVLRVRSGDGGSAWLHEVGVGEVLEVDAPRSAFPVVAVARHHLYIAGGIGITPLLSHVRAARTWQRPFTVLFGYRPGAGAHLDELRQLAGDRLHEFTDRAGLLSGAATALRTARLGTHAYLCGPAGMLTAIGSDATEAGWPAERVHVERFAATEPAPGKPFRIRLSRSGQTLSVAADQSMLDRLLAEGLPVPHMCRQGVCGECRLVVRSGGIEHRDHYLSHAERTDGTSVMPCVSRGADDLLEVEL